MHKQLNTHVCREYQLQVNNVMMILIQIHDLCDGDPKPNLRHSAVSVIFQEAVLLTLTLKHTISGINRRTVFTSSTSFTVKGPPDFSLPKSIREGCSSSR